MYIEQFYTPGLAEAAYYVESGGQAAIIDPLRDVEPYRALAEARGACIRYIFLTHLHTDFISGHLELAEQTGSKIVFGPHSAVDFEAIEAQDSDIFYLGEVLIKVLHTPGHSLESTCFLLINDMGKDYAVFTGDTLLVGKSGRPEPLENHLSQERMAELLYNSIHKKLLTLEDDVIIYPAHVAGRYNGMRLMEQRESTIGEARRSNPSLQPISKEEFVEMIVGGPVVLPPFYQKGKEMNRTGYRKFSEVLDEELKPFTPEQFKGQIQLAPEKMIIDTRPAREYAKGALPHSINIGLNGRLGFWTGSLISIDRPVLLVCEQGKEQEAVTRLADIGFENVVGYLKGGVEAWQNAGEELQQVGIVEASQVRNLIGKGWKFLDVRDEEQAEEGYIPDAIHIPLSQLYESSELLNPMQPYLVISGTGYRSMIAVSLLKSMGFIHPLQVEGGIEALAHGQEVSIHKPVKVA